MKTVLASNAISAETARSMRTQARIDRLSRELTSIYEEIASHIARDQQSLCLVSPNKFSPKDSLVREIEAELKKQGYVIRVRSSADHVVYDISWEEPSAGNL